MIRPGGSGIFPNFWPVFRRFSPLWAKARPLSVLPESSAAQPPGARQGPSEASQNVMYILIDWPCRLDA